MPFNHWEVKPKYLSRKELDKSCYDELEAVTNNTLVALIQQLACVAKYASWIFEAVSQDLKQVQNRSESLKSRIEDLTERASTLNAKSVQVPVGDLTSFSQLKDHYAAPQPFETALFGSEGRPLYVQLMYSEALVSPVHIMREIDQYREDGCRTSKYFVCTPVLCDKKSQVDLEIETRRPASILTARNWQSDEELGIPDDCKDKENAPQRSQNGILKLPSPQERVHALSLKYPSSYVPIDTTGFSFRRMASFRRSLVQQVEFFTRRKKKKKTKKDRRNTISGGADLEAALKQMGQSEPPASAANNKHKRFSMVESSRPFKPIEHTYSSLRLPAQNKSVQTGEEVPIQTGSTSGQERIYEKLKQKKEGNEQDSMKKNKVKRKSNIPIASLSQAMSVAVRLRETGNRSSGKNEDSGQSSSGNWSASSSTRASVESEHIQSHTVSPELGRTSSQTSLSKDSALSETTTPIEDVRSDISAGTSVSQQTVPPKASNTSATVDTAKWLRSLREEVQMAGDTTDGTSTTGTLTPLLGKRALSPFEIPLAFMDDEESSVYSVDTDGYYTSMHTDSGLRSMSGGSKPLEVIKDGASVETNDNCSTLSSVSSIEQTDSEGKNNASGAPKKTPPPPPARNSSLSRKDHGKRTEVASDNKEVVAEPKQQSNPQNPSPSSRSSSLSESDVEIKEHFKDKTLINASRIPSMCIVTPSGSDDEDQKSEQEQNPSGSPTENLKDVIESVASRLDDCDTGTGFHTLPRNFGKSWSFNAFSNYSTHSWPRSVSNPSGSPGKSANKKSLGRFSSFSIGQRAAIKNDSSSSSSSDINECQEDGTKEMPRLPLKYVQHLTVTPGGRAPTYQDGVLSVKEVDQVSHPRLQPVSGNSGPIGIGVASRLETKGYPSGPRLDHKISPGVYPHSEASSSNPGSSKVIHATNSMERKKSLPSSRTGAHVVLDPSGQVIHTTNSLTRTGSLTAEPQSAVGTTRASVVIPPPAATTNGKVEGQNQRVGTIESSFCTSHNSETRRLSENSSAIPRRVSFPDSQPAQSPRSAIPVAANSRQPPNSRLPPPSCLTRSVSFKHPVSKYDHNTLPRTRVSKSEPPSPLFPSGSEVRNSDFYSTLPRHSSAPHYPSPNQTLNGSLSDSDSQPSPKSQMKDMPPPMTLISPSAQQASRRWAQTPPVTPPPSIQPLHPPLHTSTPRPSVSPVSMPQPVRPRPIYYASVPAGPQSLNYRSDPLVRPSMLPQPTNAHNIRPITPTYQKGSMIPQPQVPVPRHHYPPMYTSPPPANYARSSVSPTPTVQYAPNSMQQQLQSGYQHGVTRDNYDPRLSQQYSQRAESPQMYIPPQPPQRRYVLTPTPPADQRSPSPYNYTIREASPTPCLVRMTPQRVDWSTSQPTTTTGGHNASRMGNGHVTHMASSQDGINGFVGNGHLPNGSNRPGGGVNGQTLRTNGDTTDSNGRSGTPQPRLVPPGTLEKKSKSKMSTDDLFAAIHQSKKRLNVKSDADRSLSPTSSRSASPALSVASYSSRSSAPETGVLSPRVLSPGDRKSWSGDMTVPQSPAGKGNDRRSWAVDRLGPSKPTTMHDFKMLLLQAGRPAPKEERQRVSASEMLKVASPSIDQPIRAQSPANNGHHRIPQQTPPPQLLPPSKSYSNGGVSPVQLVYDLSQEQRNNYNNYNNNVIRTPPRSNGHSPGLQYGRGRSRTPFHTRTDILSTPIMEDNMEDYESSGSDGESPHQTQMSEREHSSSPRFV